MIGFAAVRFRREIARHRLAKGEAAFDPEFFGIAALTARLVFKCESN
jgi:hypothetical protein